MQAILIHETGGPDVLVTATLPDPEPGPGELVVRNEWAGLNYIDTYHRTGLYPYEVPFTPGQEGSGRVVAVGTDVDDIDVGDHVAWTDVMGSYAELVRLPAHRTVAIPPEIATNVAAATMLQGLTAHYLARDTFRLAQDDRCLIHAAAGGVGRLLVQMAIMIGAEVFATVGSDEKVEIAKSAGADHVINYQTHDFKEVVEDLAGPRPLDVVYDGVGATTLERGLALLKRRGLMVAFGNASGRPAPLDILALARAGSLYITRPTLGDYVAETFELRQRSNELFSWIVSGRLDVRIGARFSLAEAADAHRALEGRGVAGKILLQA